MINQNLQTQVNQLGADNHALQTQVAQLQINVTALMLTIEAISK
jgi:hypothetical protein